MTPTQPNRALEDLLARLHHWARSRVDVAAVLLVGSWARNEAGPDSDVDVVIVARDPQPLLDDRSWLGAMGEVVQIEVEDWGRVQSLRVMHGSGLEVEYGLTDPGWLAEPLDTGTQAVLGNGVKIIWDLDRHLQTRLGKFVENSGGRE